MRIARSEDNDLTRIARRHDTDKGDWFTRVYYDLLEPVRDEPLRLLEIGVYNGGSLHMWREFLPNATLFAIDVDPRCLAFERELPGTTIALVDQANPVALRQFADRIGGELDVVIDDGGHTMNQQLTSFEVLFPYVVSGGAYVIEDLGTAYWVEYGGRDLGQDGTSIALVKRLIDAVHIGAMTRPVAGVRSAVSAQNVAATREDIISVSVHPGQAVILKR
jgi:Methyltransferase domain